MTHYEILQVIPTASQDVIKMAYKALAKKYHPDTYQGDKAIAEKKMKEINEAYAVLSSPMLRFEYDRKLKEAIPPPVYKTTQTKPAYQAHAPKTTYQAPPPKKQYGFLLELSIPIIIILVAFLASAIWGNQDDVSQPSSPQISSTEPSPTITTAPSLPIVAEPRSGTILSGRKYDQGSEITVTASGNSSCVVKLKNSAGTTKLSFYVNAGDTVTIGVPAEHLYVYFASGETWYGKEHLFGEDTYYSKDEKLLDFTNYSWEYTLYPAYNGNFSETPIDADEFN